MEEGHGVAELLIPSVPAVRIATRHHFTTQLIGATALQSMPQQGRSDFERHPEILEPSGEGMPEVMKVEIGHFRFGKLLFQMLGVFAEFERSMIVERVKAGLKRARAEGKVFGRPRVSAEVEAKVMALRKEGRGMRAIARELGIGNCTVQRILSA